jgi:hypothetical protein
MGDFLERARDLNRNPNGGYAGDFLQLAYVISLLQQVHSKADLDLYNLESVFGALEMVRMLGGHLPGYDDPEPINNGILAMRKVIAQTLEQTIGFPCPEGIFRMPDPYRQLIRAIAEITEKEKGDVCGLISFNDDILAEMALFLSRTLGYKTGL